MDKFFAPHSFFSMEVLIRVCNRSVFAMAQNLRIRYELEPAADGLPIEDFKITPSLGVSFEIVTGPPQIVAIGSIGQSSPARFQVLER